MPDDAPPRVRPFAPGDREFVLSLAPRLLIGIPSWRDDDKMLRAVDRWLNSGMDQHGGRSFVFIAEDVQGAPLGFAIVEDSSHFTGVPQAELGELVVKEASEGRGVGRALVAACAEWARARGHGFLTLGTGAANTQARRFYQRLGFLEEDVRYVMLLADQSAE
jgi:GNAT superfamily N-acetyltransferase